MRATRLCKSTTLDVICAGDWKVLIEMMETHIRSVASRPDRIHHRVDVFTGVSRIWEIDGNAQMLDLVCFGQICAAWKLQIEKNNVERNVIL